MNIDLAKKYYDSPQYLTKLRAKVEQMKKMEEDEYYRAEQLLDVYAVDPVKFIEDFLLIKFTEMGGEIKPFFLFEYQKKIIYELQEREMSNQLIDYLVDKPRGMGITWLMCGYFLWRLLFTPNYSAFILSRSESEVDNGSRNPDDCIFGKFRFMIDRLPKYILPQSYSPKVGRGTTTDMNLKLFNPDIGSSLIGSTTNSSAGRSRRYQTVFIDEAFFIENFQQVYRSLESVARLKIFVSTVVESIEAENFKKMCEERGNYHTLDYKAHPWKDEEWFLDLQKKAEQLDDPDLLREAVVDYKVNPKSQYYPEISQAKIEPFEYNPKLPVYLGLDFGGQQDFTVILYAQYDGQNLRIFDGYSNTQKQTEWYAPFLNPEVEWNSDHYTPAQQEFLGRLKNWQKPKAWFGELDHTIKRRPTNQSDADVLAKHGIRIVYNRYAIDHPPRRRATATILSKTIFNENSPHAMKCYNAIAKSKYAGSARSTTEQLKPVHGRDGSADYRAAMENLCVNFVRVLRLQRSDIKADSSEERNFYRTMVQSFKY